MQNMQKLIVMGKRQCVFMRDNNTFQLVVVCDEVWEETPATSAENRYIVLFELSASAACVWEMLKDCPSKQTLHTRVARKTCSPVEQIIPALDAFLTALESYALIQYQREDYPSPLQTAYQLPDGWDRISIEDVQFDIQNLTLKPIELTQEAFCDSSMTFDTGPSSPVTTCCVIC